MARTAGIGCQDFEKIRKTGGCVLREEGIDRSEAGWGMMDDEEK